VIFIVLFSFRDCGDECSSWAGGLAGLQARYLSPGSGYTPVT